MSNKNFPPVGTVVDEDKCKGVMVIVDKNRPDVKMSLYEMSRWDALIEAVGIIGDHLDTNTPVYKKASSNWVKPIAIQKYIDERTPSKLHENATERKIAEVFVPCTI
tara:strand:- start:313 stop:633 length:321 start_codon:yes stop_codon:yes gene_type:complete